MHHHAHDRVMLNNVGVVPIRNGKNCVQYGIIKSEFHLQERLA